MNVQISMSNPGCEYVLMITLTFGTHIPHIERIHRTHKEIINAMIIKAFEK